jgi:hypothetical protein
MAEVIIFITIKFHHGPCTVKLVGIVTEVFKPYEEKTSYMFLGALFIYVYPNKLSIESLQLMFDLEEKEEIFKKWCSIRHDMIYY